MQSINKCKKDENGYLLQITYYIADYVCTNRNIR